MSVRRPSPSTDAPLLPTAPQAGRRLDEVLRAGQSHLVATNAKINPQDTAVWKPMAAWEDSQAAQQVEEAMTQARVAARTNQAALDRARAHRAAAARARAAAAVTRVQLLEAEAQLAAAPADARTADSAAELARLREQLASETRRADDAADEARRASAELVRMRAQRDEARKMLRAAAKVAMEANAQTAEARSALQGVQSKLNEALEELDAVETELDDVRAQVRLMQTERDEEKQRMVSLAGQLAVAENERDEAKARQLRSEQLAAAQDEQRQAEQAAQLAELMEQLTVVDMERQGGQLKAEKLEARVEALKSKLAECEAFLLRAEDRDESDDDDLAKANAALKECEDKRREADASENARIRAMQSEIDRLKHRLKTQKGEARAGGKKLPPIPTEPWGQAEALYNAVLGQNVERVRQLLAVDPPLLWPQNLSRVDIPYYIWSTFDEKTPKGGTKTLDKAMKMVDLFAEHGFLHRLHSTSFYIHGGGAGSATFIPPAFDDTSWVLGDSDKAKIVRKMIEHDMFADTGYLSYQDSGLQSTYDSLRMLDVPTGYKFAVVLLLEKVRVLEKMYTFNEYTRKWSPDSWKVGRSKMGVLDFFEPSFLIDVFKYLETHYDDFSGHKDRKLLLPAIRKALDKRPQLLAEVGDSFEALESTIKAGNA